MNGELRDFEFRTYERGRWRVDVVRADSYPSACYQLAIKHTQRWVKFGVPPEVRINLGGPGVCHICGCTEENCSHCIERTGEPCSWANEDRTLCTACVGQPQPVIRLAEILASRL